MSNYDERIIEESGLSIERQCAVDILEHLGIELEGEEWYAEEDRVTEMIIDVVDRYLDAVGHNRGVLS